VQQRLLIAIFIPSFYWSITYSFMRLASIKLLSSNPVVNSRELSSFLNERFVLSDDLMPRNKKNKANRRRLVARIVNGRLEDE